MGKRTNDGLKKRCKCGRLKWTKCSHAWHFGMHHGHREHRFSLDVVARDRGELAPRSRTDALAWRDRLRVEIVSGATPASTSTAPPPAAQPMTFGEICEQYLVRHVRTPTRRERGRREMEILVSVLRRAEV